MPAVLDPRIESVRTEVEEIMTQMSGKPSPPIEVELNAQLLHAGVRYPENKLYINPYFVLSEEEAKSRFPKAEGSLCRALKTTPSLFKRIHRYVLSHEMAHLYHKHQVGVWDKRVATVTAVAVSALFCYCPIPFLVCFFVVRYLALCFLTPARQYFERSDELTADLTALKITKDFEAAHRYFEVTKELGCSSWAHPSPDERISNLRNNG